MLKDYDDFLDNEQYQESLQTLESEVRNHIKIQQQLKLFMEMQQSKLDEVAKNSQINEIEIMEQIKSYEKENTDLMACLAKKEQVANKLKLSPDVNLREELMKLKMQSQKDSDRIFELEKKTKNLKENEKSQRKLDGNRGVH